MMIHTYDPHLKKLPQDPKGPSTSTNAEAKRSKCVLSGEAKASIPTPSLCLSSSNTGGPAAA